MQNAPIEHGRYDHVTALDGLRFVAAAVVLVGHCFNVFEIDGQMKRTILASPLVIFINGYGAVHLFFILSGFCLAGSAHRLESFFDLGQFYVRRFMRIHPPYVCALVLAWLASFFYDVSGSAGALSNYILKRAAVHLSAWELLPYFAYPGPAGHQLSPAWTLLIELNFSFLLPLMVWISRRSHWSVLIVLSGLALLQRNWPFIHLDYAIFFSLGIVIFEERERLAGWAKRLPKFWFPVAVVAGLLLFGSPSMFRFRYGEGFQSTRLGWLASAAGGAVLICCTIFIPAVNRLLSSRFLRYGGRISYSFYLLHYPIMILCVRGLDAPVDWLDGVLYVSCVFSLTFLAAMASFRFIERPSIQLGNFICRAIARRFERDAQPSRLDI